MSPTVLLAFLVAAVAGAEAACPADWVELNGDCYWWTPSSISGSQLADACRAVLTDAVPVSVHSAAQNSQLAESLVHGFPVWLGLYRPDGSGAEFAWTDGSQIDFQFWADGQPAGDGELCVYINADPQTGTWAACDCQQWMLPYMCRLPGGAASRG
ncbi:lectin BRA-3-like [Amphibalanus amphitrite]|uniref:lectin BRA-3-like n=1 Tax=Amphibalanus amphitrite TaxID=1232801 RepID=UPI001C90FA39|nr:lectin BRA-3-like [Amphibalanus amphitrite]